MMDWDTFQGLLQDKKRVELQKLCKDHQLKASGKVRDAH